VQESFEATAKDPFGVPYTYTATRTVVGRPHVKAGVAGLVAVMLASAVEASSYARTLNVREQRVSASLAPTADGMALRLSLR
jgi:hypothetical protein